MSRQSAPGPFVGERLTEARQAMGLNPTHLANLLDLSRPMIYRYEGGDAQPSDDVLQRICTVLRQPARFFFDPNVSVEFRSDRVHYRANKHKNDQRDQGTVRLKWIMEYYAFLESNLELPQPNFPAVTDLPEDPSAMSRDQVEEAAVEAREFWRLGDGPLPNLVHILEMNGAVIGQVKLDLGKLDGLSQWNPERGRPFILLNTDKASCVRSRFDLAHELGHMILHRHLRGAERGTPIFDRMEVQAHLFAGAFLMPRHAWLRDVHRVTLGSFLTLKAKWRTSVGAMIKRAEALGLIDRERAQSLWKQYSQRRWWTGEPFDEVWEREKPRLFEQATILIADHSVGPSLVSHVFPRRTENLSEITGLPRSFFEVSPLAVKFSSGVGPN